MVFCPYFFFRTLAFGLGSTTIPPLTHLQNYSCVLPERPAKQSDTRKKLTWKGTSHFDKENLLVSRDQALFLEVQGILQRCTRHKE